ncbi:ribonuclease [Ceratobasidium sp. AG-Ba]|nr:ribonuclease [Ceratobasidium sp. AG-Ba]
MSNLIKGTNSPLGVSAYILRVLERPRSLQNHEAQLFELFYALLRGIMDSNIRSIQNHTAYKQNLISNLVSILKFIPCDSLLSDFSFVSQVLAASGLILNGHQLDPESVFRTIGRYAQLDEHQPGLLLFIGLLGLIQASQSIDAGHAEDILPTPELEVVFERLIQLKVFLVSNTEGSWPSQSLRLPFKIGNVEYTYTEYALDIISSYYIQHINADSISQHRCAGLAAGLIVANVMADDCILDYWRPIVDDALSQTGSPKTLRWVYPNTRSHAAVRVKAPFLDVALLAVLTLLKHEPKTETQAIRLVQCFHEMADQLQEVSRRVDEPIVNDLLERIIEEDMIDPFVNALLSIRADRPYSKYWRGIDAEPKVAWWGARLIWLVRRSVRRRENEEDGGAVADIVERFCLGRDKVLESEKDEKSEVKLSIITEYQERDERENSEDPKPLPERLALFKFVLLSEMSQLVHFATLHEADVSFLGNPGDTQSILEEVDEPPKLKRSWTQLVHKTRRKLSGPSENTQYSALV